MMLEAVKLISYYCSNTDPGILCNSPPFKLKDKKLESEYTSQIRKQMLERYLRTSKKDSNFLCFSVLLIEF